MNATFTIDVLDGSDLVALAQCMALDATAFPHPSVPQVLAGVPRVWIARRDVVLGFVATATNHKVLDVVGLAVDAAHQRAGVGRALVRTAVDVAYDRHLLGVTLNVSTANEAAIALYESEGFIAVERMKRYYRSARFGDGGDAFRMVLAFNARPMRL